MFRVQTSVCRAGEARRELTDGERERRKRFFSEDSDLEPKTATLALAVGKLKFEL